MYNYSSSLILFHLSRKCSTKPNFDFAIAPSNKMLCIENIKKSKAIRWLPHIKYERHAAVLIPLCHVDNELSLLFTLRTTNIKKHRGQVSFPGGVQDPDDGTIIRTALRETQEELGIAESEIDVWCECPSIPAFVSQMQVTPVVGYITKKIVTNELKINPAEVEEAFTVPLRILADPRFFKQTHFKSGITTPVFLGGKRRVWGLTGMITHFFLSNLLSGDIYKNKLRYNKPYVQCNRSSDGPPI